MSKFSGLEKLLKTSNTDYCVLGNLSDVEDQISRFQKKTQTIRNNMYSKDNKIGNKTFYKSAMATENPFIDTEDNLTDRGNIC
jgi:hypothetical protein